MYRIVASDMDETFLDGRHEIPSANLEALARMRELGVTRIAQGQRFKTTAYEALLEETGLTDEQVAYMGDDVPDLPLLMRVGLSTTPADGNPEVLNYTHWQSRFPGGRGAVRELSELILKSQGAWDTLVHNTYVLGK